MRMSVLMKWNLVQGNTMHSWGGPPAQEVLTASALRGLAMQPHAVSASGTLVVVS